MSLVLVNNATDKQLAWLHEHDYCGKMKLTQDQAEQLIDEIIEQERLALTTRQRGYVELLTRYDPDYFEKFKSIKYER